MHPSGKASAEWLLASLQLAISNPNTVVELDEIEVRHSAAV